MTTNAILFLRFLRMTQDFPELNHKGTEPSFDIDGYKPRKLNRMELQWERERAEREFFRLTEQSLDTTR